jgi:hypothetical protein
MIRDVATSVAGGTGDAGLTTMDYANSKTISRLMILAFVGLAFAVGAAVLMSSHDGALFTDAAAS